jgi:hypothetical protein
LQTANSGLFNAELIVRDSWGRAAKHLNCAIELTVWRLPINNCAVAIFAFNFISEYSLAQAFV